MEIISIFNNKGGVGKTTLTFHFAHALAKQGYRTLLIDADPQCNLTIHCIQEQEIEKIWEEEDDFIDDYDAARKKFNDENIKSLLSRPRSLHFILKPTEDGTQEPDWTPTAIEISKNLLLVPGRLTLHTFEDQVAARWDALFAGNPLSIRTATKLRRLAVDLGEKYDLDYVIIDTSPSLGRLNRIIISTTDGFVVPCTPDLFSLYGIKNIGKALAEWQESFRKLRIIHDKEKLSDFPLNPSRFLGYVLYNSRKRSDAKNSWKLSKAAYHYAELIPSFVMKYISESVRAEIPSDLLALPIGGTAIMHSHAGMPSASQRHRVPMWLVPSVVTGDQDDYGTILGQRQAYEATYAKYVEFASDVLQRLQIGEAENV